MTREYRALSKRNTIVKDNIDFEFIFNVHLEQMRATVGRDNNLLYLQYSNKNNARLI